MRIVGARYLQLHVYVLHYAQMRLIYDKTIRIF
jgi:hypothetical protein